MDPLCMTDDQKTKLETRILWTISTFLNFGGIVVDHYHASICGGVSRVLK